VVALYSSEPKRPRALDLRVIALELHDKSRRPKSLETFVQENIAALTAA
jgi:hypothetical protein